MGKPIRRRFVVVLAALFACAIALAQQPEVSYSDEFQSYGSPKNPPGWVDTAIGSSKPAAGGLFKTWPDPTQGNKASNIVFGSKSSSGKPEGNHPRMGHFSTLTTKTFSASGRFEYRGRFIRTNSDSRIGFTFLSSYPEQDQYYLVGLWSVPGTSNLTMQLFGFGAGTLTGTTNSSFTPAPNSWYRFLISVDDIDGVTKIRARFWADGTPEPATFSIDAIDAAATRLKTGRIGIWAAVKGANYVDDLFAKSPVDYTAPVITFSEGGVVLPPNTTTALGHDARVDVHATDDLSGIASLTTTADGQPYVPLTPITAEGPHTIAAVAVDRVGNRSSAETTVLVDKTPPAITLTSGGSALPLPVSYFRTAPAIDIQAVDLWTGATVTATLDGQPYASGTLITTPGVHHLTVQSVDGVGNTTEPVQAKIVVDFVAPVIRFLANGVSLTSPSKFKHDPAIEIRVEDDYSPVEWAAKLDGNAWSSLDPVPSGWHTITVTAKDAAGNESSATLEVLVDKEPPVVVLTAGGVVLDPAQTAKYKDKVAIDVSITDATLVAAKSVIALNGQPYTSLTEITAEGNPHTLTVHAEDEAGNVTDVTLALVVDSTPPVISFSANGVELDARELQKFRADAVIAIAVTDAFSSTPTYEAALVTGEASAPYASGTPIGVEARHALRVTARDDVGNTAEATLQILVDKTAPVIAFSAAGQPLDTTKETPFAAAVAVDVAITDALTATPARTIRLDGSDYEPGTPIATDGHHVVVVHAEDEAGNTADAEVRVLVDQTGPVIAFFANGVQLDPAKRNDFKVLPAIEIRVDDALSDESYDATLNGATYTSGTPLAEGHHTIVVHAKDALDNATEATLGLLVDVTPPVVVLKNAETGETLPATGAIFGKPLTVDVQVQDTSTERTIVALLDGTQTELLTISDDGRHTLAVTVTDELDWSTTVTTEFIVDTKPPVLTVKEGTTPLQDGASFSRDVVINISAEDITTPTITATIDGEPYTSGTPFTRDGTHTLAVNAVDQAGNQAPAITLTFHIDRYAPEVTLVANGTPLTPGATFADDVTFTVAVTSATDTTRVATIDDAPYTLGSPYAAEGNHHIKVVVTNMAALSTTVEADFTIDKTPPTLTLYASEGTPFTDSMEFGADITPIAVADDNLAKPPVVVVLLDGQTLAPDTVVSEEKRHTISATATDKAGRSTTVGPFAFVLDKTAPEVTVTVDGEPLVDGALFDEAITPVIEAEDLTDSTFDITLDGASYIRGTLIEPDGEHTLVVRVTDELENVRALEPIHFTIDKTAPVVRIIDTETNEPFTGGKFSRALDLKVQIEDETATITTATLVDRTPEPDQESPWASEQEISSDGHYTLKVTVTDEANWVTVVPPIELTIDKAAPVISVTESGAPLVTKTIFNRNAIPKIDVQDTTVASVDAKLDDAAFVSETPVTVEGWHTLVVKATDELGFTTELLPIEFAVDKTPPVVTVTEQGVPFTNDMALDHDASPSVAVSDVTAYTIDAKVDGAPFTLGSLVTAEGPHTFDVTVKDAAGWTTTLPTIHFVIDKTAPVVTVTETETGGPLESGEAFGVTLAPFVHVSDITGTTIEARLDGERWTPSTPIADDGEYVLEVSVTDAVGHVTTVPPIAFIIDKTAPVVQVLEQGQPFVSTKLKRAAELDLHVEDLTGTTIVAHIGDTPVEFPVTFDQDGNHTLTVTVTDALGHATVVPPIAFTIDQTPPVVNITVDGQPLTTGDAFNRPAVRPAIAIQDTTATTTVASLNGAPYAFDADITAEDKYTLAVEVTDELGWKTTVPAIVFFIDRTAPVVTLKEGDNDLTDGLWFNRDVTPRVDVSDTTSWEAAATLAKDGGTAEAFELGTAITAEGSYRLTVTVTDKVGLKTEVPPVTFTIDKTSPAITVLYPAANAALTTPQVVVVGDSDDAITVTVNETIETTIDATEKKYSTIQPVDLLEGENALTIVGVDRAGNHTTITQMVRLDTRAPELAITAPATNACLTARTVEVTGTVGDPNVAGVRVSVSPGSASPIDATLGADRRTWTATVTFPSEGKFIVSAAARDNGGHESVASVQVSIDETKPVVAITDGGVAIAPFVNRSLAPVVRVVDADAKATLTATLDGAPYVSGTPIVAEKDYELKASATDCAGNKSDDDVVRFTIDRTPPQFLSVSPANGASIGEVATVTGTVSPDTVSVVTDGIGMPATVSGGAFSFASLPVVDGLNSFTLVAIDRAGNATRLDYSFRVKTTAPTVAIVENGSPIVSGTRYTRPVTVVVQSNEADAVLTATHNGQPFTSGSSISQNGSHTIHATARDTFGHASTHEVTFTIDSDGPVVTITEPQNDSAVSTDRVRVRGTITGDPVSALINGADLPLAGGTFDAEVALDLGPNTILVEAFDAAGNAGRASVDITRGGGSLGLILHTPADNTLTNRRTTTVAGQVLTPAGVTHVSVNGIDVPVDAAGAFRKTDFALAEGQNAITATVRKGEATGSVSVTVTADFTPPVVTLRESGKLLEEEERFATQAVLTVEATDGGQPLTPNVLIDAAPATSPVTVTASGGHTIVVTAQDAAGNEKRVERTFFIGTAGAGACALSDFDPADGSVVTTNSVTLVGRSGGAAGVKVNGVAATVSNGTFSALVNLSADGDNTVTINCTDASGNDTGTPATITLTRVTGAPSIDITTPADRSVTDDEIITVSGTIAGEVSKVVVNGAAATVSGTTFTASNVRLASGINTIVARAFNTAGLTSTDSIRVTRLADLPKIAITSPPPSFTTSGATIDVSGTWTSLDPSSVTVTGGAAAATVQSSTLSDTTGTFVAPSVPLSDGQQTITVRGTDRLGRAATATIAITRVDGLPSITITSPADNAYFGTAAGDHFTVNGSFAAQPDSTIEVNGQPATIDAAAHTFTAQVDFASVPGGLTPVIARINEPAGNSALDAIRVTKLASAPTVVQVFPETGATNVDPGTLPLVLFSAAMDRSSVRNAFSLKNASGAAINGDVTLERDVLVFAPAVLLASGETYTIRVAAGAQDLAGNALAADFTSTFTVTATASATAPSLGSYPARVCEAIDLAGTAPAGAQVRIELGTLKFNTTASSTGAFSMRIPLSGRSGFQVARVRVVGTDGSLSPAAEAHFEVDCAGAQVVNATIDRTANVVAITFSKAIDLSTVTVGETGSVRLQLIDGTFVGGTASASTPAVIAIAPAQSFATASFTLTVTTAVQDTTGAALTSPYSRSFSLGDDLPDDGSGYIAGEIFDADTGRPLPGATLSIDVPTGAFARRVGTEEVATTSTVSAVADNRGRYVRALPEGAHTIRASAEGYTTVWRQIIVRAGVGVIPTDIRLTPHGQKSAGTGAELVLTHGGPREGANSADERPLSRPAELRIPAGVVATGTDVTLTSLGAQSLPGLLPLGWSPIASAEIVSSATSLSGADLTFVVRRDELVAAAQTLTAVRYHADRDEWRVIAAAVNVAADGKATIPVAAAGAYALVYPDKSASLQSPPSPASGGVLTGVADPCASETCPPLVAKNALELTPPVVLPTQRTVATLRIEGSGAAAFPSGTAVQAYVDEELHLADGTRDVVSPFVTDLLLYRTPASDTGVAEFHLAPSERAAEVVLEVGYDHIRILPYPERLDRGALIGPEGGRVPADDLVAVEIPAAATTEALKATATSIRDFSGFGAIAGYRIVGGLSLSLQWASAPPNEDVNPVELLKPARATFTVTEASLPSQLILVEVLEGTPYGRVYRLASQITALEGGTRFTTKPIDRAVLPVDGIIREGTYLLLAPNAPIAFATGTVHLGAGGPATAGARVVTPGLGVIDLSRLTGIFNVPVPAAPFTLVPRTPAAGDGATYTHPTAPAVDEVVPVGELSIVAQPPSVSVSVFAHVNGAVTEVSARGASDVSLSTSVKASFSPGLDPLTVREDAITVIDESDGSVVSGRAAAQGGAAILWSLTPGTRLRADARYTAVVSGAVRGTNGTPLGTPVTATFSTAETLSDPNVDPSKIRITIPDAEGRSQIVGAPGALKEHWNAVAVRVGRDFTTRPQATADAQRSFVIRLGESGDASDRVTIADVLYLQIINEAGAVAAILPLGPFTSDDNRGFVARPDKETRYTTVDNVTLSVPAGAFEVATLVRVEPAQKVSVADVPGFDEELTFHAGFKLDFEGIAKKRLDVTFPTPATLTESQTPYLGFYGISSRGPRIMLIDLLRRDGANLTTNHPEGSSVRMGGVSSNAIVNPTVLRDMLLGIDRPSIIIGFTFQTSINFVTFAPPPVPLDFFIPPIKSMYFASFAVERDRILVPIPTNVPFHIIGVDPGSGLTVVDAPYGAQPPGAPGDVGQVELPSTNDYGPYPVFSTPGRTEVFDIRSDEFTEDSAVRNLLISFNGTSLRVKNANPALPDKTRVEIVNLRTGTVSRYEDFKAVGGGSGVMLSAQIGDRVLFLIGDHDVDPAASVVTIAFSEPIHVGTQAELRQQFELRVADPAVTPLDFKPVTGVSDIDADSGNRRINVRHRGGFQRGRIYRLVLSGAIKDLDVSAPLKLGQKLGTAAPGDLMIDFEVRGPKGLMGSFNLLSGGVRDLAMSGNVLLVSTLDGGIVAYDASNPAKLASTTDPATGAAVEPQPMAKVPPPLGPDSQTWALATDDHGRVFATALSPMYGVLRSYRIEDFYCTAGCTPPQKGNAIIAWRTGINVGMPLASMIIGGWPEATPRKMQIVTKDAEPEIKKFPADPPPTTPGGPIPGSLGNGYRQETYDVAASPGLKYDKQRVTVVNVTRNYKWSKDIDKSGTTAFQVIGKAGDQIRIVRNLTAVGVVSLFGHGVGVYDLNAIDANYRHIIDPSLDPGWERLMDNLALDTGDGGSCGYNLPCSKTPVAAVGNDCPIADLAYTPDAALALVRDGVSVFALEQKRGIAELHVKPIEAPDPEGPNVDCYRPGSLVFAEKALLDAPYGREWIGHPRLKTLVKLFQTATGRDPVARYTSIGMYDHPNGNKYAIVAGNEMGLLVAQVGKEALNRDALADVVWIPGGAYSVRVMQEDGLAVVVDGKKRVVLVNLVQIDERDRVPASADEPACTDIDCAWTLFPTAKASLTPIPAVPPATGNTPVPNDSSPNGVGFDDPRIVWKSAVNMVTGTIAPIVDSETGYVYTGDVLGKKMNVVSAVDPMVRFVGYNSADSTAWRELSQIVPLGIEAPKNADGSTPKAGTLAAFQLLVSVPGSMTEDLAIPAIPMAIESERVLGAVTAQTPTYLPPAHLRQSTATGGGDARMVVFNLQHDAPSTPHPHLRYQRGWNRMISKWVVAIADPRAAKDYNWGVTLNAQQKADRGCFSCERPDFIAGTLGTDWYELYTTGRVIAARPEACIAAGPSGCSAPTSVFDGTKYLYLGQKHRLHTRIATTIADTVRPTHVLTAASGAPAAVGAHQDTVFVHSGEVMTGTIDLDAGGRAGWNVVADRTYRSRTLGYTALGAGWDSSMFRRLRLLPTRDVEYRDGSGETWLFKFVDGSPSYASPDGFDAKLTRSTEGWRLTDAKKRITDFDGLGRLTMDADEFYELTGNKGNVIRYAYDGEGRLARMTDPVGRTTTLKYDAKDRLERIEDWRVREVLFHVDDDRLLTQVELPRTKGIFFEYVHDSDSTRAKQDYKYLEVGSSMTERVELGTNLEHVREPGEAPNEYRVSFEYDTSGVTRDMVKTELWNTVDDARATFTYTVPAGAGDLPVASEAVVHDALKQKRTYTLTSSPTKSYASDRVHTKKMIEAGVPVWQGAPFGQLPGTSVTAGNGANAVVDRTWTFDYEPSTAAQPVRGRLKLTKLEANGTTIETTHGWEPASSSIGAVLKTQSVSAPSGGLSQSWNYDGAYLKTTTSDGLTIETPEAHRGANPVTATDGGVEVKTKYNDAGLVENVKSTAVGTEAFGTGSETTFHYHSATDTIQHRRGRPEKVEQGTGDTIRTDVKYPEVDVVTFDRVGRNYHTVKEYDEVGRLLAVKVTGTDVDTLDEFGYDAAGRLRKHRTKQDSSGKAVEERYKYDRAGRIIEHETHQEGPAVSSTLLQKTTYEYDLPNRTTHATRSGASVAEPITKVTTTLDGLGRVQDVETDPQNPFMLDAAGGPAKLVDRTRYDVHGNAVFRSNDLVATAIRYDGAHRLLGTLDSGGIGSTTSVDGFGRVTSAKDVGTGFEITSDFTAGGKLKSSTTPTSSASFTWDGAGRQRTTTRVPGAGQPNPMSQFEYDNAGRLLSESFGEGVSDSMVRTYQRTEYDYLGGDQPKNVRSKENDNANTYTQTPTFDALGRATKVMTTGATDMTIEQSFDSMGNSTRVKTPSKPAATEYAYDGRGLVTEEKQPDAMSGTPTSVNQFDREASGALKKYTDATGEPTETKNDGLGRPYKREYADGTWEEIHYEQSRVLKMRDRQGRWQHFLYDGQSNRLKRVLGDGGLLLDELDYDPQGRLIRWKTHDTVLEFSSFDAENRPQLTTQTRLRADGTPIDSYSQSHAYDGFGRRTTWTMPGSAPGWTASVSQRYDAAGNVIQVDRTLAGGGGGTLLSSDYRATGRPKHRTLNVNPSSPSPFQIKREYDYDLAAGRLNAFRVFSGGTLMAGSEVTYDGTLLKSAKLLGLANGGRTTSWEYDQRGRLRASIAASGDPDAAATSAPFTILPKLNEADFIEKVEKAGTPAPAKTFGETANGHKIAHAGDPAKPFEYKKADGSDGGSVRTGDGRFLYEFDEKERLRRVTQRPTGGESFLLRVVYSYSGLGRMIGRRVEIANASGATMPPDSDFHLATAFELGPDAGLPPETTFVWDPISDRMVAIFDATTGQPLRQFIHGGMGLDDPVEVTVAEAGGPARYYPIFDEAGDGGLQVILSETGKIVSRTIISDPYGDGEIALSGPAVEKVTVTATGSDGVDVEVAFTEPIAETTLAAGVRLTSLTNANPPAVAATSTVTPAIAEEGRVVRWSLSASEWAALTSAPDATSLSIAVTETLRASTYTEGAPVMPANTTLRSGVYATAAVPFELRESLTELATRLAATTPYDAYELTTLTGAAPPTSGAGGGASIRTNVEVDSGAFLLMVASFQAQSFTDPLTLKNYVRARWYDPQTGTFLSTDPMGYQDSSNLYAFAGGDPVNGRDPTGLFTWIKAPIKHYPTQGATAAEALENARSARISTDPRAVGKTTYESSLSGMQRRWRVGAQAVDRTLVLGSFSGRAEVTYTPTILIPDWEGYETAPPAEQEAWDRYMLDIVEHERDHEQHGAVVLKRYEDELRTLQARTERKNVTATEATLERAKQKVLTTLDDQADAVTDRAQNRIDTLATEYHCEVQEGSCQANWTDEKERTLIRSIVGKEGVKALDELKPSVPPAQPRENK